MAGIRITRNVSIPDAEIEMRASRSGGPGGQSVNTSDSKVELRWDLAGSAALTEAQRDRLLQRLGSRLTNDGVLILQGAEHKSQHRNREAVIARLKAIVGEAIEPPRPRRRTRPSRASKERRLKKKKERGEIKRLRKPPPA
jgi:ribosome-associated protein